MSTFKIEQNTFADLDYGFNRHPVTNDVMKKKNVEAIKSAIKTLVYTNTWEKPFHPEIGGNIYAMLFENYTPLTARIIENLVKNVINNYEPRAKVIRVGISMTDDNAVRITVAFMPVNVSIEVEFDILLERTR